MSYLFDLDFEEPPNSQKDTTNTGSTFSVDARYLGNVSGVIYNVSGHITDTFGVSAYEILSESCRQL